MNKIKIFITAALGSLLSLGTISAQVVLQDFSSTVTANTYFYGTWEASGNTSGTNSPNASFSQGSGVYNIDATNATNADNSKIEFFYSPNTSISSFTQLTVIAQALTNNAATSFQVILLDSGAKTATATFNASSFLVGSYSTASSALTFSSGFNTAAIDSMIITGAIPSGTARFNFSFDNISATAVPEPSTYAALAGCLALGLVAWRRRSASA